jgi:hypothetical protein
LEVGTCCVVTPLEKANSDFENNEITGDKMGLER